MDEPPIDGLVIQAIRGGARSLRDILVAVGPGFAERFVDRSIQRLRKAGRIHYQHGPQCGWRLAEAIRCPECRGLGFVTRTASHGG